MIPGHPIGRWTFEGNWAETSPPTATELGEIFDEQDSLGLLSPDSWLALRRFGFQMDRNPIQYGCFVKRPDADEFEAHWIAENISEDRYAALESGSEPTPEEVALFQSRHMQASHATGELGLYAVHGWIARDDRNRERILVTLHVDAGSFDRVAGLFPSVEKAAEVMGCYGDFEWLW